MLNSKACIFGCQGESLTPHEMTFFAEHLPVGFILFARNIKTPDQVRRLVNQMHECVGWEAPILIDQEGGRVRRLKPPQWRDAPAAGVFATIAEQDLEKAKRAVYVNSLLIALELQDLGINVDCAPMLDVRFEYSNDIIGDRSFGSNADNVSILGEQMAKGLLDGGVLPVIKHIPGHGRATLDSHDALPIIETTYTELQQTDFVPFVHLNTVPWGMTAHIIYTDIDANLPSTLSTKVIKIIREDIGFDGLLLTDDISMKALSGSFSDRVKLSLDAGCDIVLHCNGDVEEMEEIAAVCPALTVGAYSRLEQSLALINPTKSKGVNISEISEIEAEFNALVA